MEFIVKNSEGNYVKSILCKKWLTMMVAALLIILAAVGPVEGAVYFVDTGRPDDSGDGLSWLAAKKTIQAGIDASSDGDTILVKYGVYEIATAISLTSGRMITSDDGTNTSWENALPDTSLCIMDAMSSGRVLTFTGTGVTELRGFKITGGDATGEPESGYGGGIYIAGLTDVTLSQCSITDNVASTTGIGRGGGIACVGPDAGLRVMLSRIHHNVGSTGGWGFGGGVYAVNFTSLIIWVSSNVTNNTATTYGSGFGGGICVENSEFTIYMSDVEYNVAAGPGAAGGNGGGIYVSGGYANIYSVWISHNTAAQAMNAQGHGGGVHCSSGSSGQIVQSEISNNVASGSGRGAGGGIYCQSNMIISSNYITYNTASTSNSGTAFYRFGNGGGIAAPGNNDGPIFYNRIIENVASVFGEGWGGGLYFNSNQNIQRNIIAHNTASNTSTGYGGGTWCYNTGGRLVYNTFYGNANTKTAAAGHGSGMYHQSGVAPEISDNIFAGHDVASSDSIGIFSEVAITAEHNCFHHNPGGHYNINVTSSNEMIADPRLSDPGSGIYWLQYDSPCIEEGKSAVDSIPYYHGNVGWVPDMGAEEYFGNRHKQTVSGTGELLFGGSVRAKVNVTSLGSLSEIDITVHPNETHPLAPVSVNRWYEINTVGSGATFNLTLSYFDRDLGVVDETDLRLWRWAGASWEGPKIPADTSLTYNWLRVDGLTAFSDWVITDVWGPTSVAAQPSDLPVSYRLLANYPNPFNPSTIIEYEVAGGGGLVTINIYDVRGAYIRSLVNGYQSAGRKRIEWDGKNAAGFIVATGIYFCRMTAPDFETARKMVLLK